MIQNAHLYILILRDLFERSLLQERRELRVHLVKALSSRMNRPLFRREACAQSARARARIDSFAKLNRP